MDGLAIIAAVARTVRSHRRLFIDDLFLLIACTFLAAGTILLYQVTTTMYRPYSSWLAKDRHGFAYGFLSLTAVFAVKFSFLFFLRVLVERIRYMTIYWRVVLGATIVAFSLCVCECPTECPHFTIQSRTFAYRPLKWIPLTDGWWR
ncbi:MAG: hypothetical protein M1826_004372 [Phylliscum demangeonii]|nr:MAG: hypothetical protein M1826_004372 [Phylliscum demangeonii]